MIISELSRLGRSVGQIIQIVDALIKNNIRFVAIKENIKINGKQDIQSKVMITMFSLFAEIERDLISERTKQGLAAAKKRGILLGRPKGPGKSKLDQFKPEIEALLKNGSKKTFIAKRYKISLTNLYKWMKKRGVSLKINSPGRPEDFHLQTPTDSGREPLDSSGSCQPSLLSLSA